MLARNEKIEGAERLNGDILRLALPSIVSNITVPLLGLCDVAIMGHVGGATHIGAIAIGSMIFNVMYWLFGFLRMSTSGLTAQAFGAWSKEEGVWSKEEGVWSKEEGGESMEEGVWRKEWAARHSC